MTRTRRIILGVTSFMPLAIFIFWVIAVVIILYQTRSGIEGKPDATEFGEALAEIYYAATDWFGAILYLYVLTIILTIPFLLLSLFQLFYDIVYVVNHQKGGTRIAWMLALIVLNVFCFPMFWYLYLRSEYLPQKQHQLPI